ncbi:MAG: isoleucine--tRNA ligase [Nitrospirae bacterium]|nr:isoleucine--tRNA ligase [Nitrospirota bacterium]
MNYKETLNLPQTQFPMKANLTQKEPDTLLFWEKEKLYEQLRRKKEGKPSFILHDGPPYANGHIHIGHALNKILKDIIVKFKTMEGFQAPYIPGWDCHGLPIEHQVLKELGPKKKELTSLEIRQKCRQYAEKFIQIQKEEFKRLGVLGDWENPYLTMEFKYEAGILRELGKFIEKGSVYKGKKPVLWCIHCETALAEAEVEYQDETSTSVYVKFEIVDLPVSFEKKWQDQNLKRSMVIWTTTPWTLPANTALCLHPEYQYKEVETGGEILILAEKRVDACMKAFGISDFKIRKGYYLGKDLEGITARHPFINRKSPLITGEHVTLDQGTGVVHTAPGHGQEDYEMGLKYGLEIYTPVNEKGEFTAEVADFPGINVFKANPLIVSMLKTKGALVSEEVIEHSYPHCWRCKNKVIFRATEQWFISMETHDLRKNALKKIEQVHWIPKWGRDRIYGMIEARPDWCISRQRVWGVPIALFHCLDCKQVSMNSEWVKHVAALMENEGADIWFSRKTEDLLPKDASCEVCKGRRFGKEMDILDVWFDSGVSHATVLRTREGLKWPADLYLEGSDQHRGWFHSSLLTAVGIEGEPPFKSVLTHGFTVDGTGKKMSKSAGNVVAPQEIIRQYGAEILRLWVAAEDYRDDVRISSQIITQLSEAYRKIRNTCRFLMGNIHDFDLEDGEIKPEDLWEIDRWALNRLHLLIKRVRKAYTDHEFHMVFHSINNFCAVDMSSFYLDILKDRLYTFPGKSKARRAAQKVMSEIAVTLAQMMAPILSFTAEEVWTYLPEKLKSEKSVLLTEFPVENDHEIDAALSSRWEKLIQLRVEVAKSLENARAQKMIGSSLEAAVHLEASGELFGFLKEVEKDLPMLFIVSQVDVSGLFSKEVNETPIGKLWVEISKAKGTKCDRCWNYSERAGENNDHPLLCERCVPVVLGVNRT